MTRRPLSFLSLAGFCAATSCFLGVPVQADTDTDGPKDPYTQVDAEGNPLKYAHNQRQLSDDEKNAIAAEKTKEQLDRDWLVRDYEQRQNANSADGSSSNLYYQLSTDKQLARLAGLPLIVNPPPGATPDNAVSSDSRNDGDAGRSSRALGRIPTAPLITPLSEPAAAGLPNFYSSLPTLSPTPLTGVNTGQNSHLKLVKSQINPLDLSSPGAVSSDGHDSMNEPIPTDLSLNSRGQSPDSPRDNQALSEKLELPLPQNTEQLHKSDAAKLTASGSNRALPVDPNAAANKPVEPNTDEDPTPVTKLPPIYQVREPIGSPYDILRR